MLAMLYAPRLSLSGIWRGVKGAKMEEGCGPWDDGYEAVKGEIYTEDPDTHSDQGRKAYAEETGVGMCCSTHACVRALNALYIPQARHSPAYIC